MLTPPIPADEPRRLQSLHSLGVLDTPPERRFDRITRVATAAFRVPIALVSLVDHDRQWFKSCVGLDVTQTDRSISFCGHAILSDDLLIVPDALDDPRFADNPLVVGEPRIRFYAGCPLSGPEGRKLGTLCIIDREPRSFDAESVALLRELGSWVEEELASIGLERALASLREQAEMLDRASESIVIRDLDARIVYFNAGAEAMYGWPVDEALGAVTHDLFATVFPEPLAGIEEALYRDGRWDGELRHTTRAGDEIVVLSRWSLQTAADGRPKAVLEISSDVTARLRAEEELRRSEELYRSVIAAMSEGVIVQDAEGIVTACNQSAERILGYGAERLLGRSPADPRWGAVREDGYPLPVEEHSAFQTLRTGDPVRGVVLGVRRPDGELRWLSASSEPIVRSGESRPYAVVTSFEDVTEQREVARMKDEFVSVVSHELRTPLTSIRGALRLLEGGAVGDLDEKAQRLLEIAGSNSDRLLRLINDILDIERLESGQVSVDRRPADALELVRLAVDAIQPIAERAGVTLRSDVEPVALVVDADRIVQTLTNLLGNAIKFSDPGGEVVVEVRGGAEGAVVRVVDRGRGIPAAKLESIFDRFQQVDASDSRQKGGTGLGLAICRSIVAQHGGRIWAESVAGVGSTFTFTLPAAEMQAVTPASIAGAGRATAAPTVAVCSAEPRTIDALAPVLERRGYRVLGMSSIAEVATVTATEQLQVVLLDLDGEGAVADDLPAGAAIDGVPVVMFTRSGLPHEGGEGSAVVSLDTGAVDTEFLGDVLQRALRAHAPVRRVLVVEDDPDLAAIIVETFQRHGVETHHAPTTRDAVQLSHEVAPDLVVLDLVLPDGDGFWVVDWLRRQDRLHLVPLVVYTAKDLSDEERERLRLGQTVFLTKGRVSPEEFERHVIELLGHITPPRAEAA